MEGFTKLFRGITKSSLWAKDAETVKCWVFLMAEADQYGNVICTIPGLAISNQISIEKARAIIADFLAPDPDSGTPEFEGRRIEPIDRGWKLLNYVKFRELESEESKATRDRLHAEITRLRAKLESKNSNDSAQVAHSRVESQKVAQVAQAEAEAEAERKEKTYTVGKEGFLKSPDLPPFDEKSYSLVQNLWLTMPTWRDSNNELEKFKGTGKIFQSKINSKNWPLFWQALKWQVEEITQMVDPTEPRKFLGTLNQFISLGKYKDVRSPAPPSDYKIVNKETKEKARLNSRWD